MIRRARESLRDLDDDIHDHIEREIEENIARGMTRAEAETAARRAFGSIARTKEDARAVWIPVWLDQLMQDARYGFRTLRRSPGFSFVVACTLALGVGLNTAVFSVVNAVLIRPLSYPHPERLLWIGTYDERVNSELVASPEFVDWRDHASSFESIAGLFVAAENIDVGDEVVPSRIAAVTDGFWTLSGARFAVGGPPQPGHEGIVLSHAFFERWFHADPSIVGRPVVLEGRDNVIAGVLARGFRVQLPPPPWFAGIGPGDVDFYRAAVIRSLNPTTGVLLLHVIGRLNADVSFGRARAELETLHARYRQRRPAMPGAPRLVVRPYAETLVGASRTALLILFAAVAFVLLITCANIANLLLARASARQREIAIRTAVGAGRGRVLRQFFVEGLLLTGLGAVGGVIVAAATIRAVLRLIPQAIPRLTETTIDVRVLGFALALSGVTTLIFALAPAVMLWSADVHALVKETARTASTGVRGLRVRKALVVSELALTIVLLISAALMMKSYWRMTTYPPGFVPDRVLTMKVKFSGLQYRDQQRRRAYIDELLRRANGAPGVDAAGVGSNGDAHMLLVIEGRPDVPPEQRPDAALSSASAGYADAIGFRVVSGRWLTDAESSAAFVVNETLARRIFPGEDPIGQRIRLPWLNEHGYTPIVGVVADLRYSKLDAAPAPELFIDYAHAGIFSTTLAIRTKGDPIAAAPRLRTLLSAIDRTQPLFDVEPLDMVLAESVAPRRFNLLLLETFAASALLLALLGIYGVIAYSVVQRTGEIGIRMALGAERRAVLAMVVRQGMRIAAFGIVVGLAAALACTRALRGLLYDVSPTDPATFVAVVVAVGVAALAACGGPALRAARVDPVVALRCE